MCCVRFLFAYVSQSVPCVRMRVCARNCVCVLAYAKIVHAQGMRAGFGAVCQCTAYMRFVRVSARRVCVCFRLYVPHAMDYARAMRELCESEVLFNL